MHTEQYGHGEADLLFANRVGGAHRRTLFRTRQWRPSLVRAGLLAAVASYLEARRHGGQWLVRIENIDPPREEAGAAERILATLEAYGFEWDGPTRFQGDSADAHAMALRRLGALR